jgi:hypothetical protein
VVESFVLNKKRDFEREEEERASVKGIKGRASVMLVPCNPSWQASVDVYMNGTSQDGDL